MRCALRTGGSDGNRRLTGATAAVLLVLLAAEGVTLLAIRPLVSAHVLIAMMLLPPEQESVTAATRISPVAEVPCADTVAASAPVDPRAKRYPVLVSFRATPTPPPESWPTLIGLHRTTDSAARQA